VHSQQQTLSKRLLSLLSINKQDWQHASKPNWYATAACYPKENAVFILDNEHLSNFGIFQA
jgi:hypothetical protein